MLLNHIMTTITQPDLDLAFEEAELERANNEQFGTASVDKATAYVQLAIREYMTNRWIGEPITSSVKGST